MALTAVSICEPSASFLMAEVPNTSGGVALFWNRIRTSHELLRTYVKMCTSIALTVTCLLLHFTAAFHVLILPGCGKSICPKTFPTRQNNPKAIRNSMLGSRFENSRHILGTFLERTEEHQSSESLQDSGGGLSSSRALCSFLECVSQLGRMREQTLPEETYIRWLCKEFHEILVR